MSACARRLAVAAGLLAGADRLLAGPASPRAGLADADYFDRLRGEVREAGR